MNQKQNARIAEATPKVIKELRTLIASCDHGALATLDPTSAHPICTRIGLAQHDDGRPLIFVSALAAHTPALLADSRCSLLVGTPGKGEPLAHARATLKCEAEQLATALDAPPELRAAYLAAHPKANIYIDLPDFIYFALNVQTVSYNAGFGRAYHIDGDVLFSDQG